MTRDEWAEFDGRVVVVEKAGGQTIGRYRHDEDRLGPRSYWVAVGGYPVLAGRTCCTESLGDCVVRLWRPEVGETVRVRSEGCSLAVAVHCTGEEVRLNTVDVVTLSDVEPAWFSDPEAVAPEPDKPSPPPIEAPKGWELVDSHISGCCGEPAGYRIISKGETMRSERLELRDGEWRVVVNESVFDPLPTRGHSAFADAAEQLSKRLAVGLGVPPELVEMERPQPFATSWIDPAKDDGGEPDGDPVYVDHLQCMGFDVSDLGVLRDGQWVRVDKADPPAKPGELLWHRGAVPERADDQVKVAMVRGESSGKSEPLRGSLVGVMVFDHALSDEEVGELAKSCEASDPPPFPRPLIQSPEQVEQRTQAEAGFRAALRRWRVVHGLVPEERVSWWVRLWRWVRGR